MVKGAVQAICEFTLLVSQQNHSALSLKALDDALKRFYQQQGIFQEQKMLKSAKAKVDDLLAKESHQLCEQKLHKIHAALEDLVYGTEKVSTTQCRQFQVLLNSARQVAPTWSDADCQKAMDWLECKIHQVTPGKRKHFSKLFQHHEGQLLLEVGTKVTSPRSIFTNELAQIKTATEDKA